MEYFKDKRELVLNKTLTALDEFVVNFVKILEKHVEYVIISGYISILLGRARGTEDVDIYFRKMSFEKFIGLYNELKLGGFWCLNAEDSKEVFSYLTSGHSIRFARTDRVIPNIEMKFPKKTLDEETFEDFITVKLPGNIKLKISSFERHVAFKHYYLGCKKDIEDALHIEELFRESIDYGKVNKLKQLIEVVKKDERRKC